ncbi:MAG: DUF4760 domain-containing protein, partial [Pseudomonadota bacterium]
GGCRSGRVMTIGVQVATSLFTVFFSAAVLFVIVRIQFRQREHADRQRATIDFVERCLWNSEYIKSRQEFIQLRDDPDRPIDVWARADMSNRAELSVIRASLNEYELVAVGIINGLYDEAIYREYWRGTLLADWQCCRLFVLKVRDVVGPGVYSNFENLAEAWRSGRAFKPHNGM